MSYALLSSEGFQFLLRWIHFFAGVIWIGLLYYFNFVQGAFFKETTPEVKTKCTERLVPRALWWFRWGAMMTFLSGWLIITYKGHLAGMEIYATSWGIMILTGAVMGTIMWFNVWFVIWPAQKCVIAAAQGQSVPNAAERGARSAVASRTNVFLSIPMLFFMGAASHLPIEVTAMSFWPLILTWAVILGLIELNALKGKTGPLTSVSGVIASGFVLTGILYFLMECLV